MIQQGINVILKVDNKVVGGQRNIQLNRSSNAIDITNKINSEWQENLQGLKTWGVTCNGIYVINSESLSLLEECFMKSKDVEVTIIIGSKEYNGKAIITNFPVNATYDKQFKYNITLLGNGALE